MKHLYNFEKFSILETKKESLESLDENKKMIDEFIKSFGEKLNIPEKETKDFFTIIKNLFKKKEKANTPTMKEMIDHINNIMNFIQNKSKTLEETAKLLDQKELELLNEIKEKGLEGSLYQKIKDLTAKWNACSWNKDNQIEFKTFN